MSFTKITSNLKITIVKDDKIIKSDKETATVLNKFFSNIANNLNIPQFTQRGSTFEKIYGSVMKAILSIGPIRELLQSKEIVSQGRI